MKGIRKLLLALSMLIATIEVFSQYVNPDAEIINRYAKVIEFPSCSSCLGNCDVVTVNNSGGFAVSDRVLLIQMKGAEISWEDDSTFGQVLNYGSAGFHELMQIKSITGNEIQFVSPIQASYDVNGDVQVVKIVEIEGDYTVGADGITCSYWNGNTGGVLYLEVGGTLTLNGDVDVRGRGFRGAQNPNDNADITHCGTAPLVGGTTSWANGIYTIDLSNIQYSGRKGEGIAEFRNPENELGIGPLANGGGGGNNHNAGGGGGSNMGAGGFGGNEYNYLQRNCGHDLRGMGGVPLDRLGGLRLFLGGGGGAGHENNNVGTSGGSGGGIIILKAEKIVGNGHKIIANGTRGPRYVVDPVTGDVDSSSYEGGNDGCGGGGAGGSIKLECHDFDDGNLVIQSRGSDGGDMGSNQHGPGGGGGGGLVCFITQAENTDGILITSEGGKPGVTNGKLTDGTFDPWGAEPGEDGLTAYECSTLETPPPRQLSVNLGPDLHLCNPPSATLNTKETEPLYTYNWFKDGTPIDGATSPIQIVGDAGIYSVELLSPNCPPAYDTVTITKEGNEYPIDTTFCNEEGPQVAELAVGEPTVGANYGWFDAETEGNLLFVGNPYTTDPLNETTTYYVTDTNKVRGLMGPNGTGSLTRIHYVGDPAQNNADVTLQEHSTSFVADVPLTIKSVEIAHAYNASTCGNPGDGSTKTIRIGLFKNGTSTGQIATQVVNCGEKTKVDLNFTILPDGEYSLRVASVQKGDLLMIDGAPEGSTIPAVITILDHVKVSGPFFNWQIEYGAPCGRMPVTATLFCEPCKKPKPLQLTFDHSKKHLCEGESADITTNAQYNMADYEFLWYKGADTAGNIVKTVAGIDVSKHQIDFSAAGTYTVLVRDKNHWDDASCWSSANIAVAAHKRPAYSLSGTQVVCDYDTTAPIVLTLTGSTPWNIDINGTGAQTVSEPTYTIYQPADGSYNLTNLSDKYCDATTTASEAVTVTVKPSPAKPSIDIPLQSIYQGQTIPTYSATGTNLTWKNEDVTETLGTGLAFTPEVTDTGRYVFNIIDDIDGCTDTAQAVLLVSGCPSPMPLPNSQIFCYG